MQVEGLEKQVDTAIDQAIDQADEKMKTIKNEADF